MGRVVEGAHHRCGALNTADTLVNHVAAHEIGHAIYSLDSIKDVLKVLPRRRRRPRPPPTGMRPHQRRPPQSLQRSAVR